MAVSVAEILGIDTHAKSVENTEKVRNFSSPSLPFPRTDIPTMVFMAGFAGAGKTTLAKRLKEELGADSWEVLHKDDFKLERLAKGEDVEQAGWNAFEELFARTEVRVASQRKSVIIDTCGYPAFILENIQHILKKRQVNVHIRVILCVADKKTRMQRLYLRGSVFTPYVGELPLIPDDTEAEAYFCHLPANKLELNTAQPWFRYEEEVLGKALAYILSM